MTRVAEETWLDLMSEFDKEMQEELSSRPICKEVWRFVQRPQSTSCVFSGGNGRMNALIEYIRKKTVRVHECPLPGFRFLLAFEVKGNLWHAMRRGNNFISVRVVRRKNKK